MRKRRKKSKLVALQVLSAFTEACRESGGYKPSRGFNRLVIAVKGEELLEQVLSKFLEADELRGHKKISPERERELTLPIWRYAPIGFKRLWLFHVMTQDHARAITLWPGEKMKSDCLSQKDNLTRRARKRLNERLRRLLGAGNYNLWINMEATPFKPFDVHFHGVLELEDASWWKGDKYKKLRLCIREAVGTDCAVKPQKQLKVLHSPFNDGWISYASKQRKRSSRLKSPTRHISPDFVGPHYASTVGLISRSKSAYEDGRIVFNRLLKRV